MPRELRKSSPFALLALLVAALFGAPPALAEEEAPGDLAQLWMIWVLPGHEADFEASLRAHAAWRKSAGEGVEWTVYQPAVGRDLTHYAIRSGGHHWADFDAMAEWGRATNAFAKYTEQLGPHVARVEHYITRTDLEHSKMEMRDDYRYLGVQTLRAKPGAYGRIQEELDKIQKAAVEKNWPRSYAIAWSIGGEGRMIVATPFLSYADMAQPDPPFLKLLAESLGSEDAAKASMMRLQESFDDPNYTIYAIRHDLSTPK